MIISKSHRKIKQSGIHLAFRHDLGKNFYEKCDQTLDRNTKSNYN